MQPAGQDPEARRARDGHSTALFAAECQSFLDNVIAGLGQIGSWNNPHLPAGLSCGGSVPVGARFRNSKAVGAVFGLTPCKYQSGQNDRTGAISRAETR
jgi:Transposase IS116/IS110/IS902 family